MLGDLTRSDWQGLLGIPVDRLPRVAVLRGTRNLARNYDRYRAHFDNVTDVGSPNGLLEHICIGEHAGVPVGYASVYGGAMASEVAHVLCVLGAELVLQTGCCGAWADGMQAGDLFLPTHAACGEGAAQYYVPGAEHVRATHPVAIPDDLLGDLRTFEGGIYTTAALFAESTEDIDRWAAAGWQAVDMETATTFAVAEHFGVPAAALLFAFDNPRTEGDIVHNEAVKDARRARGDEAMIASTFRVIEDFVR